MRLIDADKLEQRVLDFERFTGSKLPFLHDFISSEKIIETETYTVESLLSKEVIINLSNCDVLKIVKNDMARSLSENLMNSCAMNFKESECVPLNSIRLSAQIMAIKSGDNKVVIPMEMQI